MSNIDVDVVLREELENIAPEIDLKAIDEVQICGKRLISIPWIFSISLPRSITASASTFPKSITLNWLPWMGQFTISKPN